MITFIGDPDEEHNTTSQQTEPTQQREGAAQHHTPATLHPQGHKQPTALLRTIGYTGRTHSPTASPDLTLLQTTGYAGRTHSPTASPDLCAPPDNQQPAAQSGLTRRQFVRTTAHLHRPTTQAATATSLLTIWPPPPPHRICTTPAVHQTSSATLRHTHRKFTSQRIT